MEYDRKADKQTLVLSGFFGSLFHDGHTMGEYLYGNYSEAVQRLRSFISRPTQGEPVRQGGEDHAFGRP